MNLLKYNSAADSLGISVNTVRTQMKKLYRTLRENMQIFS
ncbi:RNA polymerase sigma-70 factor, ECF subfamily [Pricia antarctica]|uniref:RNA polymerase sigma-70 factor, ECF subfamily n=1 Tax=Pricia antarctica TaxID=641691 RepID=A0A1G7JD81_9FLAO|nr:RNA polymerase sigma-70 factor, ECF subfamily [Pricia antarctica]